MLEHLFAWLAARTDPGFAAFGEAQRLYVRYLSRLGTRFEELTAEQMEAAAASGDMKRAAVRFDDARADAEQQKRFDGVALARYQLGMLLHLQGEFDKATAVFHHAREFFESAPRLTGNATSALSGCYYHLGILAWRQGNRHVARHWLDKSLTMDEAAYDIQGMGLCRAAIDKCCKDVASSDAMEPDETSESKARVWEPPALQPRNEARDALPTSGSEAIATSHSSENDPDLATAPLIAEESTLIPDQVEVVWVLSNSIGANDRLLSVIESAVSGRVRHVIDVRRIAFEAADADLSVLTRFAYNERLCAAVVILEASGLQREDYIRCVNDCIVRVAQYDDFRLFVSADVETSVAALREHASSDGRQLIDDLIDTVQLAESSVKPGSSTSATSDVRFPQVDDIGVGLRKYLTRLSEIRGMAAWRRMGIFATDVAGRLAACVQTVAGVIFAAACVALLLFNDDSSLVQWMQRNVSVVALASGVVTFFLNMLPLFFLLRGLQACVAAANRYPTLMRWFIAFAFVQIYGMGFLVDRLSLPSAWIMLGVTLGGLLDYARRQVPLMERKRLAWDQILRDVQDLRLPSNEIRKGDERALQPFRCPLMPHRPPRVFISYSRRTAWSEPLAHWLHDQLVAQGTVSSLDRKFIGAGSSWRSELKRHTADADIFVAIVEEASLTRQWVAAELITALKGRAISGLPKVVVLVHPDVPTSLPAAALPVFAAVLKQSEQAHHEESVRIIPVTQHTANYLANDLKPSRYWTTALVPAEWAVAIELLFVPFSWVGPLGEMVGVPALLLAILEHFGKTNLAAWIGDWHAMPAVYLLCGYWSGFALRLWAATRFEIRHKNIGCLSVVHLLGSAGLIGLVLTWSDNVSGLFVGWAVALGWFGWYMAGHFVSRYREQVPGKFVSEVD